MRYLQEFIELKLSNKLCKTVRGPPSIKLIAEITINFSCWKFLIVQKCITV
jgi:hypothetical protein